MFLLWGSTNHVEHREEPHEPKAAILLFNQRVRTLIWLYSNVNQSCLERKKKRPLAHLDALDPAYKEQNNYLG